MAFEMEVRCEDIDTQVSSIGPPLSSRLLLICVFYRAQSCEEECSGSDSAPGEYLSVGLRDRQIEG